MKDYFEIKDLESLKEYREFKNKYNRNFPQPSSVSFKKYHIVNKDRTIGGTLVVDYINSKEMIDVSWGLLEDDEFALLQTLLKQKKDSGDLFYELHFIEAGNAVGKQQITAYTEEIAYVPFFVGDGKVVWRDVSISFVEQ